MGERAKRLRLDLSHSLGAIPGFIVFLFGVVGVVLVEVDRHVDLDRVQWVFNGNGSAARTVLSVIAGSLITVAGLTFSITMVVLQLASSQFSPRILRTFFGDRVTQVTIGTFVGTFVYSILVLRAVGSVTDAGFVPRLSVTVASLLGIGAAVLLIVFLHHVSQLIQVSHVTATIAHDALARTDELYPDGYEEPVPDADGDALLASWRTAEAGRIFPKRPGYVQRVGLDDLPGRLDGRTRQVAILVCPGDFVSIEMPIAEIWPALSAEPSRKAVLDAVGVASERDIEQDIDFGLRQLGDIALKAMSPGVNDPTTAVTCVGYLRAILVRLTERAAGPAVRERPDDGPTVFARRRRFDEHFDCLLQISRYLDGDAWVAGELLQALCSCADVARDAGAQERLRVICTVGATIAEQAGREAKNDRDRRTIGDLAERLARMPAAG